MGRNQLDQETSPYLLQHRGNPVHWRAWGPTVLAEASAQGKPILLSVGYAACHWCHVMAHESFEDEETARLMNELFIPIKVDREERPDIDTIYQTALAMLGQSGGWPLTMFLNPSGEPFWGGTYFPPSPRYGRPSFRQVLVGVATTYEQEPEKIASNVAALTDALAKQSRPKAGSPPAPAALDTMARALLPALDTVHGGLAGAPKFPQVPLFTLLWRAARRTQEPAFDQAVRLTLDRMSQGGIYDHLGGGYARYSTDERWLAPHFEKMLYDNAEMITLLTTVWRQTKAPLYAQRIAETIGWLGREMMTESGAFAATLDADSEGEEGKYYVWTAEEIDRLLPPGLADPFKRAYDVRPGGNWEGHSILNRNGAPPDAAAGAGAGVEDQLAEARALLLDHRQGRVPPARDDKALTDWNGMMIAAVAEAAFAFARADWLALAEAAFAAIRSHSTKGERLVHSWRLGRQQGDAVLDDYAEMARAGLILYEVTGRSAYLDQAVAWVGVADRHYWDAAAGGYFFTADDTQDLILRTKAASDAATPSGNGVMAEVLARLFHLTGETGYRQRAEALVAAFAGELERGFFAMGTLLNSWELLNDAVQVVLVGQPDDPLRQTLLRVIAEDAGPDRVLLSIAPGQALPPGHPATGKTAPSPTDGSARAFICRATVCGPPISDPAALREAVSAR